MIKEEVKEFLVEEGEYDPTDVETMSDYSLRQKIIGLQDTIHQYRSTLSHLRDNIGPRMKAKYRRDLVFLKDKILSQAKSLKESLILPNVYKIRIQINGRIFVIYSKFEDKDEIYTWFEIMNSISQQKVTILEITLLEPYEETIQTPQSRRGNGSKPNSN